MIVSPSAVPEILTSKFLAGLGPDAVENIIASAQVREVSTKRMILTGGQPANYLFLLVQGRARYFRVTKSGEEVLLQWLLPGDVFGLGSLLKHPPNYIGSGEALCDCELLYWHHKKVRELAGTYPQLAENALRIVLRYLKHYADRHVALLTKNAPQRLAESLLDLGDRTGHVHPDGVEIEVTNEQLGSLAHISPFTTSRLLNGWERDGAVSKQRGKVFLRAPEALLVE